MDRDNQQATVLKELSWLGGIWDGEGSFSIVRQNKKNGRFYLGSKTTMENTDVPIVEETIRILEKNNISFYLWHRGKRTNKHKDSFVVNICRLASTIKFCELLIPYLISKKERAIILQKFCISREKSCIENVRQHKSKSPNTEIELSFAEELQRINKFGKTDASTTIRERFAIQTSTEAARRKMRGGAYQDIV